jgi:hypothetical protein
MTMLIRGVQCTGTGFPSHENKMPANHSFNGEPNPFFIIFRKPQAPIIIQTWVTRRGHFL